MARRPEDLLTVHRRPGDLAFAALALVAGAALLSVLDEQTRHVDRLALVLQPAFWPGLSLAGVTLFAVAYLVRGLADADTRRRQVGSLPEIALWLRPLEFAGWFMAYVHLTPLAGYLPATLLFCILLAWRAGYRGRRMLGLAALTGAGIVLLFKTLLAVKIPGGLAYDVFPEAIRNFLIVHL